MRSPSPELAGMRVATSSRIRLRGSGSMDGGNMNVSNRSGRPGSVPRVWSRGRRVSYRASSPGPSIACLPSWLITDVFPPHIRTAFIRSGSTCSICFGVRYTLNGAPSITTTCKGPRPLARNSIWEMSSLVQVNGTHILAPISWM